MSPQEPIHGSLLRSSSHGFRSLVACFGLAVSLVLHAQSGVPSYTTNRFDIDVDGQVDFEFITETSSQFVPGPGGGSTMTSTQVTLVPQGSSRILVLKSASPLSGLPTFTDGASIGPAGTDQVWSPSPAILLQAVEPFGLSGALAPVWVFAPGTLHIGIALGSPESPRYGWMSFNRERRVRAPMAWGYSRTAGAPVVAGDASTIPAFAIRIARTVTPDFLRLTWQPDFANMTVEESAAGGSWSPIGTTTAGQLLVSVAQAQEIPRIFRARYTP